MKDIAFVLDAGLGGGGAERVAANLISSWIAQGRRVTLITLLGPEHDFYSLPAGVKRIVLGGAGASPNRWAALAANLRRLVDLRKAIRSLDAPVVISFLTTNNIRTILASRLLGKRVIISERIDTSKESQPWAWLVLRRMLYRYANVVTANSKVALENMRRYVPPRKLAYVPNPVVLPASLAACDRSTVILNVGRLAPQKNQALLVEALALLGERAAGWTAEILGKGPEEGNLRTAIRARGLDGRIVLRGAVSDPGPHYRAAGIFVLPSLYEGTPNAMLEAMAHGLPCLVSDSLPGALDLLEDGVTGLVFRGGDARDLADKLARLAADPSLRVRLGAAARRSMEAYSPERVLEVWDGLGGAPCAA